MVKNCTKCDICVLRKNIVNGTGNPKAPIFIIGEAPGYYEDKLGVPFVSTAESGKMLTYMLESVGFNRDKHTFITNTIRCRPPNNRTPSSNELDNCLPYLLEELYLVNPKIVLLLGRTALTTIFNSNVSIRRSRGNIVYNTGVYFLPTYHPSYIAHNKDSEHYDSLMKNYKYDFRLLYELYRLVVNPLHIVNFK